MSRSINDRRDYSGNQLQNQPHEMAKEEQKNKKKNYYKTKESQYNIKGREDKNGNEFVTDHRNHNNKSKWNYKSQQTDYFNQNSLPNEQNQSQNSFNKKNKRKRRDTANVISNSNIVSNINQNQNFQQQTLESIEHNTIEKEDFYYQESNSKQTTNSYITSLSNQTQNNTFANQKQKNYIHQFNNNNNAIGSNITNNNEQKRNLTIQQQFNFFSTNRNANQINNNSNIQSNANNMFNQMQQFPQFNRGYNQKNAVNINNTQQNQNQPSNAKNFRDNMNININIGMNYYQYPPNSNANPLRKIQNDLSVNFPQTQIDQNMNNMYDNNPNIDNDDNYNNSNIIFQQQKKNNVKQGKFSINKINNIQDHQSELPEQAQSIQNEVSFISDRSGAPLANQNFQYDMFMDNAYLRHFAPPNYQGIPTNGYAFPSVRDQQRIISPFTINQTQNIGERLERTDKDENKNENNKKQQCQMNKTNPKNMQKNSKKNTQSANVNSQQSKNKCIFKKIRSHDGISFNPNGNGNVNSNQINQSITNEQSSEIIKHKGINTLVLKLTNDGKEIKKIRINYNDNNNITEIAKKIVDENGLNMLYCGIIVQKIQSAIEISKDINKMKIAKQKDLRMLKQIKEFQLSENDEDENNDEENYDYSSCSSESSLANSMIHEICSYERNLIDIQPDEIDEFELLNTTI